MQFIKKVFGRSKYQNLPFRLFISLVAGIYICAQSNEKTFTQFMVMPEYYIALSSSMLIAFILVEIIHWQNYYLDKHLKWRENSITRTGMLVAFGWFLPTQGAWLMAYLYFGAHGYAIEDTGYEQHLFVPIKAFVVLLNLYYNWDLLKKDPVEVAPDYLSVSNASDVVPIKETLEIKESSEDASPAPQPPVHQNIALIYLENKNLFVIDKKNESVLNWKKSTIKDSLNVLPHNQFIRISRDVIVSSDMIESIQRNKQYPRELDLRLKLPIERTYIVPKGRVAGVRRFGERNDVMWWDKKSRKFR